MNADLLNLLNTIPDPRVVNRCEHKLVDILFIALCTFLSNGNDFEDMVEFGHQRRAWLETFLELPNGIPSHDTFNRVLQIVDPASLSQVLTSDGSGLIDYVAEQLIAFDGKKIKGVSPKKRGNKGYYILSAWASESRLCLGQQKVGDKSNEITAIPELIDSLDLVNSTVSIDAIGCQTNIVDKLLDAKANYLLAVKGNQSNLQKEIVESFNYAPVESHSLQWEYDHGRYEERKCELLDATTYLSPVCLAKWSEVNTLIKITATRTKDKLTSSKARYYITNIKDKSAEDFNHLVRGHWGIENHLHWHLDITFKEDASRARSRNAPINLNILRKMSLQRIKQVKSKLSLQKRRFRASMNSDFLREILGV